MNSSISTSEAAAWRRCLLACFGTLGAGALLILVLMVLVDPYDSGRLGWLGIEGNTDRNYLTADASRARDPQFDSAIFGNSTGQLIEPAALKEMTGSAFAQLIAPGADPRGDLAILDFFARHHPKMDAVVVVADEPWCTTGLPDLAQNAFPFWLYGESTPAYVGHLFNWRTLDRLVQRIAIWRGSRQRMRPDGFWSYEEVWPPGGKRPPVTEPIRSPPFVGELQVDFPFARLLGEAVGKLPADVAVVIVMPPTFYTRVPPPGSKAAALNAACNAAFRAVVSGRPRSNLLDYRVDNALTRDPANFADAIHYRAGIARKIEEGIAASLRLGAAAQLDF